MFYKSLSQEARKITFVRQFLLASCQTLTVLLVWFALAAHTRRHITYDCTRTKACWRFEGTLWASSHPITYVYRGPASGLLSIFFSFDTYVKKTQACAEDKQGVIETDSSWPVPLCQLGSADPRGNDQREKMEGVRGQVKGESVREKAADPCLGDS